MRGKLFNIQRFSTGDGPGIRTTLFFKGCPLSCKWCHNPESQNANAQLCYHDVRCIRCGKCAAVCPSHVFSLNADSNCVCFEACIKCGKCVSACPSGALELFGRDYTVEDVVDIALRDRAFYGDNGGVTLSGGEPCLQWQFALQVMRRLKAENINIALDTCGACKWEHISPLLAYTDLVLFDLKHMDSREHERMTGVGNELILDNFKRIQAENKRTLVRTVVIPGYNDSADNWSALSGFLKPYKDTQVELLAYHTYGISKYKSIGRTYELDKYRAPEQETMKAHCDMLRSMGTHCYYFTGEKNI